MREMGELMVFLARPPFRLALKNYTANYILISIEIVTPPLNPSVEASFPE